MAFIIPCSHKNTTNIPESYEHIVVTIKFINANRLVYRDHDDEGREFVHNIIEDATTTLSDNLDPFCNHCKADIVENFSSTAVSSYSVSSPECVIVALQKLVYKKVEIIDQRLNYERSTFRGGISHEILHVVRYYDRPCTRQEYEAILRRVDHGDDSTQPRPTPAAKSAIEELERVGEAMLDEKEKDGDCVVCLEGLISTTTTMINKEKKIIARLPCKHVFHKGCALNWLRTSHLCPLCRFEFPVS